ncbi:hypothetical protein Ancab_023667 [Ancistrocladus abbreviatus]
MGNCGQSASKQIAKEEEQEKQFEFHPPEAQETDYDDTAEEEEEQEYYDGAKTPQQTLTVFLQTPDAVDIESEDPELMSAAGSSPSKKLMDPRLMSLLEFFRQLSAREKVLFRRRISIHREDFGELLNNMERSKEMEMERRRRFSI